MYDRTSLANVAVLWNQANSVFYGRDQVKERVSLPWRGMLAALHEERIPFLPVYDFTVTMPANGNDTAHIKYLVSGKCAEIAAVDDEFVIPVEKIEDHEVLVIE